MKRFLPILFAILLITGCSGNGQQGPPETNALTENPEVIADSLEVPWSIEKLVNTYYLTERPGSIVKVGNGEIERQRVELKKELATLADY